MPQAPVNGIALYYEVHGSGVPSLLIQGLGCPCEMWFAQLSAFSERFTTVIFDNRGAGRSEKPDKEYSIREMAKDAIGLMDHLGISRVHVVGVSMGGFIAQEMAIAYPDRIMKLVLLSTSYGAGHREGMQPLREKILAMASWKKNDLQKKLLFALTPEFYWQQWEAMSQMVKLRRLLPPPAYAFRRQFEAAKRFEAKERVKKIAAPTFVLSGTDDPIVPLEMARRLAQQIPNARFHEIKGATHLAFIESAEEVNQQILEFIRS